MGVNRFKNELERQCKQDNLCMYPNRFKKSVVNLEEFFTVLLGIYPKEKADRKNKKKCNVAGATIVNALAYVRDLRQCFKSGQGTNAINILIDFIGTTIGILSYEGIVPEVKYNVCLTKYDLTEKEISISVEFRQEEFSIDCNINNCFDVVFAILGSILSYRELMADTLEFNLPMGIEDDIGAVFRFLKKDVYKKEYSEELKVVSKYKEITGK